MLTVTLGSCLTVEQQFHDQVLFERLPAQARASMRSQVGPGAGIALSVVPTGCLTQIPPHLARGLRHLRPIDSFYHHRAAYTRSGVLGRREFALESAASRI